MMAATPPACCAGADHAKPRQEFHRIGRADYGGFVLVGAGAVGVRRDNNCQREHNWHRLRPDVRTYPCTLVDKLPVGVRGRIVVRRRDVIRGKPAMYRGLYDANPNAYPDAHCITNADTNAKP